MHMLCNEVYQTVTCVQHNYHAICSIVNSWSSANNDYFVSQLDKLHPKTIADLNNDIK